MSRAGGGRRGRQHVLPTSSVFTTPSSFGIDSDSDSNLDSDSDVQFVYPARAKHFTPTSEVLPSSDSDGSAAAPTPAQPQSQSQSTPGFDHVSLHDSVDSGLEEHLRSMHHDAFVSAIETPGIGGAGLLAHSPLVGAGQLTAPTSKSRVKARAAEKHAIKGKGKGKSKSKGKGRSKPSRKPNPARGGAVEDDASKITRRVESMGSRLDELVETVTKLKSDMSRSRSEFRRACTGLAKLKNKGQAVAERASAQSRGRNREEPGVDAARAEAGADKPDADADKDEDEDEMGSKVLGFPRTEAERVVYARRTERFRRDIRSLGSEACRGLACIQEEPSASASTTPSIKQQLKDDVVLYAQRHLALCAGGHVDRFATVMPRIILKRGPPGTGKTLAMHACANEVRSFASGLTFSGAATAVPAGNVTGHKKREKGCGTGFAVKDVDPVQAYFLSREDLTPRWEGAALEEVRRVLLAALYPVLGVFVTFLFMDEGDSLLGGDDDNYGARFCNTLAKLLCAEHAPQDGRVPSVCIVMISTNEARVPQKIVSRAKAVLTFPPMTRGLSGAIFQAAWDAYLVRTRGRTAPSIQNLKRDHNVCGPDDVADDENDGVGSMVSRVVWPSQLETILDSLHGDARGIRQIIDTACQARLRSVPPHKYAKLVKNATQLPLLFIPTAIDLVAAARAYTKAHAQTRRPLAGDEFGDLSSDGECACDRRRRQRVRGGRARGRSRHRHRHRHRRRRFRPRPRSRSRSRSWSWSWSRSRSRSCDGSRSRSPARETRAKKKSLHSGGDASRGSWVRQR